MLRKTCNRLIRKSLPLRIFSSIQFLAIIEQTFNNFQIETSQMNHLYDGLNFALKKYPNKLQVIRKIIITALIQELNGF